MTAASLEPMTTPVEWRVSTALVPYPDAVAAMEERVARIAAGEAREMVWLLEHPPVYTAGTSAKAADLVDPGRFPVYATGRGGQYTYHGPGQRIAYVMLNLKERGGDIRGFVQSLEGWIVDVLGGFGVAGSIRDGRVGVWVDRHEPGGAVHEEKIAALGIRVRRGVSFHGISLNVDPDLGHFGGIVPCGLADYGVTSLAALGIRPSMSEVDAALQHHFFHRFQCRDVPPAAAS